MNLRRTALAGVAGAAALAPAAPAHALGPITDKSDTIDPVVRMAERAHDRALRRNVRLHRVNAQLRGDDADARRRAKVGDWSTRHLRRANERLADRNRRLRRQAVAVPPHLEAIAQCESGGDPTAVDSTGTYRGKYQFDMQTWASVGGSGDPAAAPEAEQDRRAAILYARAGASPWPVCGA
ncbi:MAG TPA: transglycosylase family protein [Solirubrobacteraceae bacterium]|nr:transglycosylase family protein [Solirubrobacteraceae bacterium]